MTPSRDTSANGLPAYRLLRETRVAQGFAVILFLTAVSGFSTDLFGVERRWEAWVYLAHALLGLALLPLLMRYLLQHVRRTLGLRRPLMVAGGYLSAALLLTLGGSGLAIIFVGMAESRAWLFELHRLGGWAALVLFMLHALTAVGAGPGKRRGSAVPRLILTRGSALLGLGSACLLALGVVALDWSYAALIRPPSTAPAVTPYDLRYGEHPFAPSQSRTHSGTFVAADRIGNSNRCGGCHPGIYDQWAASAHRLAAMDPSYVKNVDLLEATKGIEATRYCEGCHAPVALLSGELSAGGSHGGTPGTLAFHEGVGCMGCHGITGLTHAKGVASYEIGPTDTYLFEHATHPLARRIHEFLIRIHPAEHRRAMAPDILARSELCASCHESFMDEAMNDWGWVKMQNDYSSWASSRFSGRHDHAFPSARPAECGSCHFPLVDGADPSADTQGQIRSHRSPGANTVLPQFFGNDEQLDAVRDFLTAQRVAISIEKPSREDAVQDLAFVDRTLRSTSDLPYYFYLGEAVELQVSVSNLGVGHDFPGGTRDINEAWIYLRVTDAENRLVFESGALGEDGALDETAQIYRTVPVDRFGRHVWKHDLFRMIGDVYASAVPAGSSDVVVYRFNVPYWAKSQLGVTALVRYRKFNRRYAQWVFDTEAPRLPVVDMARASLTIPLRLRAEVEADRLSAAGID